MGDGWKLRTKESRAHILNQLKDLIAEMRRIPPPRGMGVASVDRGTLYDCRLPKPATGIRFGPFQNVSDFHLWLRAGCETHSHPEVCELIAMHEQGAWPLCFTHGDLSSLNILVRGEDIVGIIDWETAGWFPSYWEYTTAWNVNPQNQFWREEVSGLLEPRPRALAMEKLRDKCFGDLGA